MIFTIGPVDLNDHRSLDRHQSDGISKRDRSSCDRSRPKRYKTLLFDVDDTLLDFHAAQDQALDQLFTSVDIEPTATVKHAYATYNQGLWEKLERNEITRDELMATLALRNIV